MYTHTHTHKRLAMEELQLINTVCECVCTHERDWGWENVHVTDTSMSGRHSPRNTSVLREPGLKTLENGWALFGGGERSFRWPGKCCTQLEIHAMYFLEPQLFFHDTDWLDLRLLWPSSHSWDPTDVGRLGPGRLWGKNKCFKGEMPREEVY